MKNKNIIKNPSENIISVLNGKNVLFLERDNSLSNGVDEFHRILEKAGIKNTVLFNLSELPVEDILEKINNHDCIVFQTQWVYEISYKLLEYVKSLQQKKIVVECYINEPTWYFKRQHGSKHDVYIYSCMVFFGEAEKESEKFYKLTNKPYWDYKNKFDK